MQRNKLFTKIGRRLADLRKAAGLTQARLAEAVDLSNEAISRLERGVTMPSVETLVNIAEALSVEPKELLEWGKDREASEKDQLIRAVADILSTRPKQDAQMIYDVVVRILRE